MTTSQNISSNNEPWAIDSLPEPWLMLPKKRGKDGETEGAEAYAAFEAYYTASPDQRTIRQVALKIEKSETLLERWSSRFFWLQRAEAWYRRQDRIAAAAREQGDQEERAKWNARKKEVYEFGYKSSRIMASLALQTAKLPVTAENNRIHMRAALMLKICHELSLDCIRGATPEPSEDEDERREEHWMIEDY